jgi:UDP-N-acetylmuramoyl-tripeptide--D-alanyl-D-alanine ligase
MHELGESSADRHADIGTLASELGIDHLVCIGAPEYSANLAKSNAMAIHLCANKEAALQLTQEMRAGDVVLVKASRAEKFEEIAQGIQAQIALLIAENKEEGER